MRPLCRELKLRSDVFPMKKELIDTTTQLDLNKTARNNEKTQDTFCPYMNHMTYAVVSANLAYPVGVFNKERELAAALEADEKTVEPKTEASP